MNALNTESKDNTVEKESKIQTKLVECVQTLYISDNVDEAINRLLQIIGEFYNAERCYIFEFDNDMNITTTPTNGAPRAWNPSWSCSRMSKCR